MLILLPSLAGVVVMIVALPILIWEATLCLWLLFKTPDEHACSGS